MSWRSAFNAPEPETSPPVDQSEAAGAPRDPLRVSDLIAVIRVLDTGGDGTIPVTSWEPDEEHARKGRWHHTTRNVRLLAQNAVQAVKAATEPPWRAEIAVRATNGGWLAVTEPVSGEVVEIRAQDAPAVWRRVSA